MSIITQGSFLAYGTYFFTKKGFESASSSKSWEDLSSYSDLSGKSYAITGANSGCGYQTSLFLARRGATVHMLCRNRERGEEARKNILESIAEEKKVSPDEVSGKNIIVWKLDVSEMDQIRQFVSDFEQDGHSLDVLVNNAGCMLKDKTFNSRGIEAILAANVLSNFLLTNLLLPTLAKSKDARVILVTSGGMLTEPLLIREKYEKMKEWSGRTAYARTKRHQVALTEKWTEKYTKSHPQLKFVSVHPGWADTPAVKEAMPDFYDTFKSKLRTPEQGADSIYWLCVTNKLTAKESGTLFRDRKEEIKHFCISDTKYDQSKVNELWDWFCELSGFSEDEIKDRM